MEANWLVLQSESSDEFGPHWIAATPFAKLEDAKEYVKHVLNDEWEHIVLETSDPVKVTGIKLGDHPGYKYPDSSSIKHSLVYFDYDGTEAWDMMRTCKKIKIVQICKEGERTC